MHRRAGLADRAAERVVGDVGHHRVAADVLERDPQGHLVAARRVDVVDLGVERLPQSLVVRVPVVVQDDLLVQRLDLHMCLIGSVISYSRFGAVVSHAEELLRLADALGQRVTSSGVLYRENEARCWPARRARGAAATRSGARPGRRCPARRAPGRRRAGARRPPRTRSPRRGPAARRARGCAAPGSSASSLERVRRQRLLVGVDGLHAELGQVVDRRAQPDRLGDRHGAGLELVRRRRRTSSGPSRRSRSSRRRPGTAASRPAAPGGPRAPRCRSGRTSCARRSQEVGAQVLHVDRHVRHGLGRVDQHQRAHRVRAVGDQRDRVDRAEHVGLVDQRDQLGPLGDQVARLTGRAGRRR